MDINLLLGQLLSSDNALRSEAEKTYQQWKTEPTVRVLVPSMLLSAVSGLDGSSCTPEQRQLSAVLLRRLLLEDNMYHQMDVTMYVTNHHSTFPLLILDSCN